MQHSEFKIGGTFRCDGRLWRCIDIGTRTIWRREPLLMPQKRPPEQPRRSDALGGNRTFGGSVPNRRRALPAGSRSRRAAAGRITVGFTHLFRDIGG